LFLCLLFLVRTPVVSLFPFTILSTSLTFTLSLHDALPIYRLPLVDSLSLTGSFLDIVSAPRSGEIAAFGQAKISPDRGAETMSRDRKSTRLNSSHVSISYAVFCLKKKKNTIYPLHRVTAYF